MCCQVAANICSTNFSTFFDNSMIKAVTLNVIDLHNVCDFFSLPSFLFYPFPLCKVTFLASTSIS